MNLSHRKKTYQISVLIKILNPPYCGDVDIEPPFLSKTTNYCFLKFTPYYQLGEYGVNFTSQSLNNGVWGN